MHPYPIGRPTINQISHALAREVGHPNNPTIREEIALELEGRGSYGGIARYLARLVGVEEANHAMLICGVSSLA